MRDACLILPGWEMEDEAFFRQQGEASCSQALVLIRGFNDPDICRKGNAAAHGHSRGRQDFH